MEKRLPRFDTQKNPYRQPDLGCVVGGEGVTKRERRNQEKTPLFFGDAFGIVYCDAFFPAFPVTISFCKEIVIRRDILG
jgi:hypothetical protein